VKVQRNQEVLTQPKLGAIGIFLGILQLCLAGETDASQAAITEQLLDVSFTFEPLHVQSSCHEALSNKQVCVLTLACPVIEDSCFQCVPLHINKLMFHIKCNKYIHENGKLVLGH
jgi:hypothetical protein